MKRVKWSTRYAGLLIAGFALIGCSSFTYTPSRLDPVDWGQIEDEIKVKRVSLPEKCAPFYQDGTDNWINCMGVGYK